MQHSFKNGYFSFNRKSQYHKIQNIYVASRKSGFRAIQIFSK